MEHPHVAADLESSQIGLCADYDLNSYGATKVALFVSYFHRGLSNQLALMQT